ncbi:spore coat protein [Paenibacillus sp. DMB20]|uniref:spore coat protein n=1 Tax=Paenibacillus sp. DMB20 TaxID=1642570 RepID=UPI00069C5541|nr:spore coat protein [Paenibacillus sp. DMB20]
MKFGAHEVMDTHEVLAEKMNAMNHFGLYAAQAKNPQLKNMIQRHQQEGIRSYNEIVALTRGSGTNANTRPNPLMPSAGVQGMPQEVQYGINRPQTVTPHPDAVLTDNEIASALLITHKNGAKNCTYAALECTDVNLRRALTNSSVSCINQAYEVFLFMNDQGQYPVPTLEQGTAQAFLNTYQPAPESAMSGFYAQSGAAEARGPFMAGPANPESYGSMANPGGLNPTSRM